MFAFRQPITFGQLVYRVILIVALVFAAGLGLRAQQSVPSNIELLAAGSPPQVPGVSVSGGATGNNSACWWVVPTFPIGNGPVSAPACLNGIAGPSASNPITVSWVGVSGATLYRVLRTDTPNYPSGVCPLCSLTTTATTSYSDTGGAGSNYNQTIAPPAKYVMQIDNLNNANPVITTQLGGTNYAQPQIAGTPVVGNCAKFGPGVDQISDAGAVCGAGGGTTTFTPPYINVSGALYGPIFAFTDPSLPTYSWVNQGGATIASVNGAQLITSPLSAGGAADVHAREITPPAAPYTLTVAALTNINNTSFMRGGIGFRESATGKLATVGLTPGNISVDYWTDPTTYGSTPVNVPYTWVGGGVTWFRIQNTGSALNYSVSKDGQVWIQVLTTGLTAHFTVGPNRIFFYLNPNNATFGLSMLVLGWQVT